MRSLLVITLGFVVTPAYSQIKVSLLDDQQTINSAQRGDLAEEPGELLTAFTESHWRGLGDNGSSCAIQAIDTVLQDMDSSTQETYSLVVRSGDDAKGPEWEPIGLIAKLGPFTLPANPAGGPKAFKVSVTPAVSITIPCESYFAVGVDLPPGPLWASGQDGLGVQASWGTSDEHVNSLPMSWQIHRNPPWVSNPPQKMTFAIGIQVDTPTLQMSINGKKSVGGLFPRSGHIVYAGNVAGAEPNALSLIFLGVDTLPSGVVILGGTARLYLGFTKFKLLAAVTATADAYGNAYHPMGHVPSRSPVDTYYFQAALLGKSRQHVTNMQASTFDQ